MHPHAEARKGQPSHVVICGAADVGLPFRVLFHPHLHLMSGVRGHTLAPTCAPFSHAGPLLLPLCFVELSVGEKPTPGVQYPPMTIAVSFAR